MSGPEPDERSIRPVKRRRRRLAPLIIIGTMLVLVVVAFVVVDGAARGAAEDLVAQKVRSSLSLPEDTPVDVKIGGASVLIQAALGELERVDVAVDQLAIGELSGGAALVATGVPIDQSRPISTARLRLTVGQDDLQKLLAGLTGLPASSAAIVDGAVALSSDFRMLGFSVPVGATVELAAVDGRLAISPRTIELNGAAIAADQAPAALRPLFEAQTVCVATLLPPAFVLDSVQVGEDSVTLAVSGSSIVLNSELLTARGTCPA